MQSKEEIEKDIKILKNISECFTYSMWSEDTETLRRVLQYIEQLESDKQKLIEKLEEKEKLNDKYLQKLVYSLSPTTHSLGDSYNNAFKKIIADNIDLETCKIKKELKDCWEGRF